MFKELRGTWKARSELGWNEAAVAALRSNVRQPPPGRWKMTVSVGSLSLSFLWEEGYEGVPAYLGQQLIHSFFLSPFFIVH